MTARLTSRSIVFRHPFTLKGMTFPHPPGTFELQSQEEQLDVMWDAYHTTLTLMLTSEGQVEAWAVKLAELNSALAQDRRQEARKIAGQFNSAKVMP